jgi:hypothetical protein
MNTTEIIEIIAATIIGIAGAISTIILTIKNKKLKKGKITKKTCKKTEEEIK